VVTVPVRESTIANLSEPLVVAGDSWIALTVIESPFAAAVNTEFTVADAVSPILIAEVTGVRVKSLRCELPVKELLRERLDPKLQLLQALRA
jgi:hypothetical protein